MRTSARFWDPDTPSASSTVLCRAFDAWSILARERAIRALVDLIAIDTTSPFEENAFPLLTRYLCGAGFDVREEPIPAELFDRTDYVRHPGSALDPLRRNLRCRLPVARAPRVVFNAHVDVVPPGSAGGMFIPRVDGDWVYGRGAADTKNNIVMLVEAVRFLAEHHVQPTCEVRLDIVLEEEIGGGGTHATISAGVDADAAVVLEPTALEVFCAHRGCLGFSVEVQGRPTHMGGSGESAIDAAYAVLAALRDLEDVLIAEAKRSPLFAGWDRPVQINVGSIAGGDWPGSVPSRCTLRGNMGTPATWTLDQAERYLVEWLRERCSNRIAAIRFDGLRNDAYEGDPETPIARALERARRASGLSPAVARGWHVSCDARYYSRMLGLPTVIFGSGSLEEAHSDDEGVSVEELMLGSKILALLLSAPLEPHV